MEEFFKDLDILVEWYNKNYITLDMYMKIKSNICDYFKEKNQKKGRRGFTILTNKKLRKQIELMADYMVSGLDEIYVNKDIVYIKDNRVTEERKCNECIIKYFERKIEK